MKLKDIITKVPLSKKINFLPSVAPKRYLQIESNVYTFAQAFIMGYKGASWDYYYLGDKKEKIGFMALPEEDTFTLVNTFNQTTITVNGIEAGLIISVMAFNQDLSECDSDQAIQRFRRMSDIIASLDDNGDFQENFYRFTD